MNDFNGIARLLDALHPWLGHLVIVGGWAHRLHRFHPLAHPPGYAPLLTRDADVAFASTAPLGGDISAALKAAGFTQEPSGEHIPPMTLKRDGTADVTIAKAGITAQKLRHLDLLLTSPCSIRV